MREDRNKQILNYGFKAAEEQMALHPYRPEYPKDFSKLYEWMEDKLFNLYDAIRIGKRSYIRTMAGEVIITACEVAELVYKKEVEDLKPKQMTKKKEVKDG